MIKYVQMLESCCENEESLHNFVENYKNEEEKLAGSLKVAELTSFRYQFIKTNCFQETRFYLVFFFVYVICIVLNGTVSRFCFPCQSTIEFPENKLLRVKYVCDFMSPRRVYLGRFRNEIGDEETELFDLLSP